MKFEDKNELKTEIDSIVPDKNEIKKEIKSEVPEEKELKKEMKFAEQRKKELAEVMNGINLSEWNDEKFWSWSSGVIEREGEMIISVEKETINFKIILVQSSYNYNLILQIHKRLKGSVLCKDYGKGIGVEIEKRDILKEVIPNLEGRLVSSYRKNQLKLFKDFLFRANSNGELSDKKNKLLSDIEKVKHLFIDRVSTTGFALGYVENEGMFNIRENGENRYVFEFSISPGTKIEENLYTKREILEAVSNKLGGRILDSKSKLKRKLMELVITKKEDLKKLLSFFTKNEMVGMKGLEFLFWKWALLYGGEPFGKKGKMRWDHTFLGEVQELIRELRKSKGKIEKFYEENMEAFKANPNLIKKEFQYLFDKFEVLLQKSLERRKKKGWWLKKKN